MSLKCGTKQKKHPPHQHNCRYLYRYKPFTHGWFMALIHPHCSVLESFTRGHHGLRRDLWLIPRPNCDKVWSPKNSRAGGGWCSIRLRIFLGAIITWRTWRCNVALGQAQARKANSDDQASATPRFVIPSSSYYTPSKY